ncbi:hypothetical protein LEN26_006315 [Aphanomyces euteiches]|nr:hypothetical protein AeMF1_009837 [Aphanomyces euteiches]KAH9136011.1 hypothetical protein LEN26_006315 [Aphanomyces euteiches]KAH9194454.1 hypothetical protein AeNC1_003568 [Aphanomyces euteiches]
MVDAATSLFGCVELMRQVIRFQDGLPGVLLPLAGCIRCSICTQFDFVTDESHMHRSIHDDPAMRMWSSTSLQHMKHNMPRFLSNNGYESLTILLLYKPSLVNCLTSYAASDTAQFELLQCLVNSAPSSITTQTPPYEPMHPLILASKVGFVDAISFLLDSGVIGSTAAMDVAAQAGQMSSITCLQRYMLGCSSAALHSAVENGHWAVARHLMNELLDPWTALWHAVENDLYDLDRMPILESVVVEGPLWIDVKAIRGSAKYLRVALSDAPSKLVCRLNGVMLPLLPVDSLALLLRRTALPYRLDVIDMAVLHREQCWIHDLVHDMKADAFWTDCDEFDIVVPLQMPCRRARSSSSRSNASARGLDVISTRLVRKGMAASIDVETDDMDDEAWGLLAPQLKAT